VSAALKAAPPQAKACTMSTAGPKRVLIVESDLAGAAQLRNRLVMNGHRVKTYPRADRALFALARKHAFIPDLIIVCDVADMTPAQFIRLALANARLRPYVLYVHDQKPGINCRSRIVQTREAGADWDVVLPVSWELFDKAAEDAQAQPWEPMLLTEQGSAEPFGAVLDAL
jgi:hypothetical protein